ncbi:MAG: DUF3077 domain-containing protein [Pseudomonas sp.]|uniref:DUF3077 domain-containing protein n=1 Tax=Pseudomonas abieticivorans TaxID=2931382 RepID=UPI0020BEE5D9|nr:DUF3077 domain-containing protein [Pseudomonas sp. PIA16]MDE1167042.1 DUF3077 domain-containing protein [Pseudomonas sp.]
MTEDVTPPLPTHHTSALPFGTCGADNLPLFIVREGIGLEDALVHVSHLLRCAHDSAYELCDSATRQRGLVWSTVHSIEAAKGLVDALLESPL